MCIFPWPEKVSRAQVCHIRGVLSTGKPNRVVANHNSCCAARLAIAAINVQKQRAVWSITHQKTGFPNFSVLSQNQVFVTIWPYKVLQVLLSQLRWPSGSPAMFSSYPFSFPWTWVSEAPLVMTGRKLVYLLLCLLIDSKCSAISMISKQGIFKDCVPWTLCKDLGGHFH